MSLFFAKAIRLLLWIGSVLGMTLAFVSCLKAFGPDPDSIRYGSPTTFMIAQPAFFLVAATWLGIALSGIVLAIALQAFIIFVEHARNQFVTASAMQLIKAEQENAGPNYKQSLL